MQSIQMVVVAPNDLVRNGIQMLMNASQSIEITRSFSSIHPCEQYLGQNRADILLLDDALPKHRIPTQTVATLRDLYPTMQILVLSDYMSGYYIQSLVEHGASGFIYKGTSGLQRPS